MFKVRIDGKQLRVMNGKYCFGLSLGNTKLTGNKFAILNFTPAFLCKGDSLGKCKVSDVCYAKLTEWRFPNALAFRFNNFLYFQHTEKKRILAGFRVACQWLMIKGKRVLRLQESGDFISQWWVDLASDMADIAAEYGIRTYTYTTRDDLDYSRCKNLIVRGSGWDGPNGRNEVIPKKGEVPEGFKLCHMDCGKCGLCYKAKPCNIAFRKHGNYKERKQHVRTR